MDDGVWARVEVVQTSASISLGLGFRVWGSGLVQGLGFKVASSI